MKKIKYRQVKILSLILSTILLISSIPLSISANTTNDVETVVLGEVYIQNVATEMYIDIAYGDINGLPSTEAGSRAVQRRYTGSESQRWIIERVVTPNNYEGEIVIRSAYSGYFLGISYDDTVFLGVYDTIDDFNVWRIEENANGTYTFSFTPTVPDAYTVAIPSPNSGQNLPIRQMCEEDMLSDECDEWRFYQKAISIVNYYDESFASDSTLINNIAEANDFAKMIYDKYFHVKVITGTPIQYNIQSNTEMTNQCYSSINDQCNDNCGSSCGTQHHKNVDIIHNRLLRQGINAHITDTIYVLWSNRYSRDSSNRVVPGFCKDNHQPYDVIGFVRNHRPIIQMLQFPVQDSDHNGLNDDMLACMSMTLVHEMSHTLGMSDIVSENDSIHNSEDTLYVCIMDAYNGWYGVALYKRIKLGRSDPFCESCTQVLDNYYTNNISLIFQ